jgi:hypothetical protein
VFSAAPLSSSFNFTSQPLSKGKLTSTSIGSSNGSFQFTGPLFVPPSSPAPDTLVNGPAASIPFVPDDIASCPLPPLFRSTLSTLVGDTISLVLSTKVLSSPSGSDIGGGSRVHVYVPRVLIDLMLEYVLDERIILDNNHKLYSLSTRHIKYSNNNNNNNNNSNGNIEQKSYGRRYEWNEFDVPRGLGDIKRAPRISDGFDFYVFGEKSMRMFSSFIFFHFSASLHQLLSPLVVNI